MKSTPLYDAGEWSELGSRDIDCIGRMVMRPRERERTSHYNLFRYCHNDPLDRTDPMGLQQQWEFPKKQEVTGSHIPVSPDKLLAAREALGLSTTGARAAMSATDRPSARLSFGYIGINQAPKEFAAAREYLKGTPFGDFIEWAVNDPNYRVDILRSYSLKYRDFFSATRTGATIRWNPYAKTSFKGGGGQSAALVLGHEFDHAHRAGTDFDGFKGDWGPFSGVTAYGNREEMRVITGAERTTAKMLDETVRTDGYGVLSRAASVTDHGP